jgi:hypothetical protein
MMIPAIVGILQHLGDTASLVRVRVETLAEELSDLETAKLLVRLDALADELESVLDALPASAPSPEGAADGQPAEQSGPTGTGTRQAGPADQGPGDPGADADTEQLLQTITNEAFGAAALAEAIRRAMMHLERLHQQNQAQFVEHAAEIRGKAVEMQQLLERLKAFSTWFPESWGIRQFLDTAISHGNFTIPGDRPFTFPPSSN